MLDPLSLHPDPLTWRIISAKSLRGRPASAFNTFSTDGTLEWKKEPMSRGAAGWGGDGGGSGSRAHLAVVGAQLQALCPAQDAGAGGAARVVQECDHAVPSFPQRRLHLGPRRRQGPRRPVDNL